MARPIARMARPNARMARPNARMAAHMRAHGWPVARMAGHWRQCPGHMRAWPPTCAHGRPHARMAAHMRAWPGHMRAHGRPHARAWPPTCARMAAHMRAHGRPIFPTAGPNARVACLMGAWHGASCPTLRQFSGRGAGHRGRHLGDFSGRAGLAFGHGRGRDRG
jgi:hypothetical protein